MNGKRPIRRYKRRSNGGATVVIIVLVLIVIAAFTCLILALTGHLDPIIDKLFGEQGTEQVESGGETTGPEDSGEEPGGETTGSQSQNPPPDSGTAKDTTGGGTTVNPPSVDGDWLNLESGATLAGKLVLLNNDHAYTFPTENEMVCFRDYRYEHALGNYISVKDNTVYLNEECASMLGKLAKTYAEATGDSSLVVWTGYRSYADQEALYNPASTKSCKPGCSDYHTGDAVFLKRIIQKESGERSYDNLSNDAKAMAWFEENAHRFGFIKRYPSNKTAHTGTVTDGESHYRYVGIAHATAMYERNMCLEEYLDFLRDFTYMGNHLNVTTDEGTWEIYSAVLAETGVTKLPVPTGTYTVSGDNLGAVIVCALKSPAA